MENASHIATTISLREVMIILSAAAIVVPLFYRFKISPIIGYILCGILLGPYGLGSYSKEYPFLAPFTIKDPDTIHVMAELGVMFLLFAIGLELSFERLKKMRKLIFTLGGLQVFGCAIGIFLISWLAFGVSATASAILGVALSMSSTAIVMQVLSDKKRLNTPEGRAAFGILLFQDIIVIPLMFALPFLAPTKLGLGFFPLVKALALSTVVIVAVIFIGRLVLRPIFKMASAIESTEVFMAASILVVILTGLATYSVGLSMTLGAFLAGLLLAETEYRREVEATIQPFKGLLLGVFLVSVGMGVNVAKIIESPFLIIGSALLLIGVKAAIIGAIGPGLGLKTRNAIYAGLLLGGAGEFAFVLIGIAKTYYIVGPRSSDFALTVAAVSMCIVPILSEILEAVKPKPKSPGSEIEKASSETLADDGHVIVAGLGRSGELISNLLKAQKVHYIATDIDINMVTQARDNGIRAYYGDVSRPEFLHACAIDRAKAVVISIQNYHSTVVIVNAIRKIRPDIPIVARARDTQHARRLYELGVSEAVPATLESSLQLAESIMVEAGVPMAHILVAIHTKRAELRDEILEAASSATPSQRMRRIKESREG
jgi:CPA2 family monovalent cation:H+ antiporter-2